ncbi:MAG: biopolymer transporter ExbD [Chthoniobacter sp.]
MRRFSDRHSLHTLSELNVTPLLDLAFVLLIIFMITTPLMENSVDLIIPTSDAAKHAVDPAAVQTVAINREGLIKFNNEPTTVAQLEGQLTALKEARPEVAVVIRAHKELAVQKLDRRDGCRAAGEDHQGRRGDESGATVKRAPVVRRLLPFCVKRKPPALVGTASLIALYLTPPCLPIALFDETSSSSPCCTSSRWRSFIS